MKNETVAARQTAGIPHLFAAAGPDRNGLVSRPRSSVYRERNSNATAVRAGRAGNELRRASSASENCEALWSLGVWFRSDCHSGDDCPSGIAMPLGVPQLLALCARKLAAMQPWSCTGERIWAGVRTASVSRLIRRATRLRVQFGKMRDFAGLVSAVDGSERIGKPAGDGSVRFETLQRGFERFG